MSDPPAKFGNFYRCWDHDGQRWCYGCWCLPCMLGDNAEALEGRTYWHDCCVSFLCAPEECRNLGAGYINIKQREALKMPGDECGALLCAQCVACDTARLIRQERKGGNPNGRRKSVAAPGLTEHRLLAPIRLQPTSHT